jgi:hypothetical protein
MKLVGGSLANVTVNRQLGEFSAAPAFLGGATSAITPTADALRLQRFSHSRTFGSASAVYAAETIFFGYSNGAAVDLTLRIGLPQLEQGAFATSVMPTSTVAVTRSADVASITGANFSSWYRQDEGSVYIEAAPGSIATDRGIWSIGDPTLGFGGRESIYAIVRNFDSGFGASMSVAGSSQVATNATAGFYQANRFLKTIFAFKANDTVGAGGGLLGTVDTSCLVPFNSNFGASIGSLANGFSGGAGNIVTGHIRRLTYWPTRLSNAILQALTS